MALDFSELSIYVAVGWVSRQTKLRMARPETLPSKRTRRLAMRMLMCFAVAALLQAANLVVVGYVTFD